MTQHRLEVEGRVFDLEPQPIRTSLTDGPAMLWGFQVRVLSDGDELGIKTCFVGRVSVQFRDVAAPDGPIEALLPEAAAREPTSILVAERPLPRCPHCGVGEMAQVAVFAPFAWEDSS